MKKYLIDKDNLIDFFDSEYSGTEEVIYDLIQNSGLTYENYYPEDRIKELCYQVISAIKNVINTEEIVMEVEVEE